MGMVVRSRSWGGGDTCTRAKHSITLPISPTQEVLSRLLDGLLLQGRLLRGLRAVALVDPILQHGDGDAAVRKFRGHPAAFAEAISRGCAW